MNDHLESNLLKKLDSNFSGKVKNQEILWTYAVMIMTRKNDKLFEYLTGFIKSSNDLIFREAQPLSPYLKKETNSHIDMVLGSFKSRKSNNVETKTGIEFDPLGSNNICFLEAKYLSDIDISTTYSVTRNQMARIIDNICSFSNSENYNPTFALLTPKIFRNSNGSRLYFYKFIEYSHMIEGKKVALEVFRLKDGDTRELSDLAQYKRNLLNLKMRWLTFEECFAIGLDDVKYLEMDFTEEDQAKEAWEDFNTKFTLKG